ncbi:ClbS/DfsB family four-helix bundle protein [Leadbettera azotonutricia]|nr:ClbS/DfsB family four-helix bundle protein [Leadbettera azotonutricia]
MIIIQKYPWTGTTSLRAYFIYNTSSHYEWGLKTIKPLRKLAK